MITFIDQKGCKTSKFDQNTNQTDYNQTRARTCNPGRDAVGIKNNKQRKNVILDYSWFYRSGL